MALDPTQAFSDYARTPCSVQFWVAGADALEFRSLRAAVNKRIGMVSKPKLSEPFHTE